MLYIIYISTQRLNYVYILYTQYMFHKNNPNSQFYILEGATGCTGDVYKNKRCYGNLKSFLHSLRGY